MRFNEVEARLFKQFAKHTLNGLSGGLMACQDYSDVALAVELLKKLNLVQNDRLLTNEHAVEVCLGGNPARFMVDLPWMAEAFCVVNLSYASHWPEDARHLDRQFTVPDQAGNLMALLNSLGYASFDGERACWNTKAVPLMFHYFQSHLTPAGVEAYDQVVKMAETIPEDIVLKQNSFGLAWCVANFWYRGAWQQSAALEENEESAIFQGAVWWADAIEKYLSGDFPAREDVLKGRHDAAIQ